MSRVSPAAVGGFVLGGLAIVVAGILAFGGGEVFARKSAAVVYFDGSVGGLAAGAPVTFRGVRVGAVAHVSLVLDTTVMRARIPVWLTLEPHRVRFIGGSENAAMLRRLIQAGLTAKLEYESLVTGQMRVDLDFVPGTNREPAETADPPEIPSAPSELQGFRAQLTRAPIAETVMQAQRTLAAIERVADQISPRIDPLANGARDALESTTRTMDTATTAIAGLHESATTVLGNLQGLTDDGRRQLAARGQELSQALVAADKGLQTSRDLLTAANGLLARGSRPRDDLEATLRDLAASASTLRELTAAVDRDPAVVLRGRGVQMMNRRRSIGCLAMLACVGGLAQGCGTSAPPPNVYVLGHAPAGQPGAVSRLNADVVEVRPARVPDYLDSTDILTRGEDGAIVASQSGRWGERFSVGMTRAVAAVLTARLPNVAVTTTPRTEEPRWRVWVDVDTLDVRPRESSTLVTTWGVVDRDSGKTVASEREVLSDKGEFRSDQEIVSAVDHEVAEVADHISAVLRPLAMAPVHAGTMKLGSR